MTQPTLFTPGPYASPYPDGLPGHRSRPTEHAAAVATLETASAKWQEAYAWLDARGTHGATDYEGEQGCFFSYPKRRCDLTHAGHVTDSGRKRKTPRGVDAIVWVTRRSA